MTTPNKRSGIIYFKTDGEIRQAKGNFTYNFGQAKREAIIGADGVHGFKETPQAPYVDGEITDSGELDVKEFLNIEDSTITIELNCGKTFILKNGFYAGDGDIGTEDANIQVRFEGLDADEI